MTIAGLLNQTITIYNKTGFDSFGKPNLSSGVSARARVQQVTKQRVLPNNVVVTIYAIMYVGPSVTVNVDDRITHGGVDYKVFSRNVQVDDRGATNHYKLECTKWLMT